MKAWGVEFTDGKLEEVQADIMSVVDGGLQFRVHDDRAAYEPPIITVVAAGSWRRVDLIVVPK